MKITSFSNSCIVSILVALMISQACAEEQNPSSLELSVSIMDVMQKVITPATNALWGAIDPKTDEDWLPLEEAAITTLIATNLTALGGSGVNDNEWVQAPAYQAFNKSMQSSAMEMLRAIRVRDLDAMIKNGDELYSACEGCHLQFNPGVINSQ